MAPGDGLRLPGFGPSSSFHLQAKQHHSDEQQWHRVSGTCHAAPGPATSQACMAAILQLHSTRGQQQNGCQPFGSNIHRCLPSQPHTCSGQLCSAVKPTRCIKYTATGRTSITKAGLRSLGALCSESSCDNSVAILLCSYRAGSVSAM